MPDADNRDVLNRIADALERLAPPAAGSVDWETAGAFVWNGRNARPIVPFEPVAIDLLSGIDSQKARLLDNTDRHASGLAAHDALLWGARGMGKSALAKSAVRTLQIRGEDIALVEAPSDQLESLPGLFAALAAIDRRFILFIDDIGFAEGSAEPRLLRSMLEGARYAEAHGLDFEREDALLWAKQRGSRSGRVAWQYIVELAGRAGRSLA